jgi:uncharacterized membrane protein HdeD (DUF308 family)
MLNPLRPMKKLLEVIKHPADSERFHRLVSKKQWFLLFNIGVLLVLVLTRRVHFSVVSIVSLVIALGIVNVMAWFSSKNYPNWK